MGEPDKTFGVTPPTRCKRCRQAIEPEQLYTRAYIKNDWQRDITDQGERYYSIHVDCPDVPA